MNQIKYITSTTDKSFNNLVKKTAEEIVIKMSDIDFKSDRESNKNLKSDEVSLLTEMYDDRKRHPNQQFVLAYLKID
jgi:hypothetical protein